MKTVARWVLIGFGLGVVACGYADMMNPHEHPMPMTGQKTQVAGQAVQNVANQKVGQAESQVMQTKTAQTQAQAMVLGQSKANQVKAQGTAKMQETAQSTAAIAKDMQSEASQVRK